MFLRDQFSITTGQHGYHRFFDNKRLIKKTVTPTEGTDLNTLKSNSDSLPFYKNLLTSTTQFSKDDIKNLLPPLSPQTAPENNKIDGKTILNDLTEKTNHSVQSTLGESTEKSADQKQAELDDFFGSFSDEKKSEIQSQLTQVTRQFNQSQIVLPPEQISQRAQSIVRANFTITNQTEQAKDIKEKANIEKYFQNSPVKITVQELGEGGMGAVWRLSFENPSLSDLITMIDQYQPWMAEVFNKLPFSLSKLLKKLYQSKPLIYEKIQRELKENSPGLKWPSIFFTKQNITTLQNILGPNVKIGIRDLALKTSLVKDYNAQNALLKESQISQAMGRYRKGFIGLGAYLVPFVSQKDPILVSVSTVAEGESLRTWVETENTINSANYHQVLRTCLNSIKGVYELHSNVDPKNQKPQIIIHQDIKPDNIIGDGHFIDPGLAAFGMKDRSGSLAPDLTPEEAQKVRGTPTYMPPEQSNGGEEKIGTHSDVYSLGASLYVILTGYHPYLKKPFTKDDLKANDNLTPLAILYQLSTRPADNSDITPPHQRNPLIPRKLSETLVRTMAPNPQDRATLGELEEAFMSALTGGSELAEQNQKQIGQNFLNQIFIDNFVREKGRVLIPEEKGKLANNQIETVKKTDIPTGIKKQKEILDNTQNKIAIEIISFLQKLFTDKKFKHQIEELYSSPSVDEDSFKELFEKFKNIFQGKVQLTTLNPPAEKQLLNFFRNKTGNFTLKTILKLIPANQHLSTWEKLILKYEQEEITPQNLKTALDYKVSRGEYYKFLDEYRSRINLPEARLENWKFFPQIMAEVAKIAQTGNNNGQIILNAYRGNFDIKDPNYQNFLKIMHNLFVATKDLAPNEDWQKAVARVLLPQRTADKLETRFSKKLKSQNIPENLQHWFENGPHPLTIHLARAFFNLKNAKSQKRITDELRTAPSYQKGVEILTRNLLLTEYAQKVGQIVQNQTAQGTIYAELTDIDYLTRIEAYLESGNINFLNKFIAIIDRLYNKVPIRSEIKTMNNAHQKGAPSNSRRYIRKIIDKNNAPNLIRKSWQWIRNKVA